MNKLRLVNQELVVGWQEDIYSKCDNSIMPHQNLDGENWFVIRNGNQFAYIPHDAEDRFTGKVDSKGVEVYENDEVDLILRPSAVPQRCVVVWSDNIWGWVLKTISDIEIHYTPTIMTDDFTIEVIGRAKC